MIEGQEINFELFVSKLNAVGEKEFKLLVEMEDGYIMSFFWPHIFLAKYKSSVFYSLLVTDNEANSCFLAEKLFLLLCMSFDTKTAIDPLLYEAVANVGGVVSGSVSCQYAKKQLLLYQDYMYNLDPSLATKKFFPELLKVNVR